MKMTIEVCEGGSAQKEKIMMRIRLTVAVRHEHSSIRLYRRCEYVHFIEQGYVPFANVL
jgi:hypothetical protein